MNTRAPMVHPRAASAGAGIVPDVEPRRAEPRAGTRTVAVTWHAENGHPVERCILNVYRRADGTPMIEISAPTDSPVTLAYDGNIEGVEDVVEEVEDIDLVTINANKSGE